MAARAATEIPPRLYLVTDPVRDAGALARTLAAAVSAADVASVLVRVPDELAERDAIKLVKALAPPVQDAGVALLVHARADIVARAGADGAHLDGLEAFNAARGSLQPERIAGVGALETRHDAMLAAEAGADYVMFGNPDGAGARPNFEAVRERVAWWAEVFEAPCIGYAASLNGVAALAQAGADFVALAEAVWNGGEETAARVTTAARQLQLESVS